MNSRQQRNAERQVTQYLLEAHAAELMLVHTLSAHLAMTPAGAYRTGLETHLQETRHHAGRLQKHLARRKDAPGLMQLGYGLAQGMVGQAVAISKFPLDLVRGMSPEEKLLRNARDECATEAMEIATYVAIEELARQVDDGATARLAASIRKDEEQMLERLLALIPRLTADVTSAVVDGNRQFVVSRTGAVDAARFVAGRAARTVTRSARRTERAVATPAAAPKSTGKRAVRKPSAGRKTSGGGASTAKRQGAAGSRSGGTSRRTASSR